MGQKKYKYLKSFLVQGSKKIPKVISNLEDMCTSLCGHTVKAFL